MSNKAYRLHIENFLTIEELDVDLTPGVQGFVGPNAAGKTNILTALQSILSGKHDERLIKDGAKRSEVRLEEIEDDKVVAQVSRIQTKNNSRLEGSGISNTTPKKWLTALLDEIAINPLKLISEDPVKYLKQHLPLKIEEDEIIEVPTVKVEFNRDANNFMECTKVSDEISVARRAQYQVMRHNQEVADEVRKNLPPLPEKPKQSKSELEDKKADIKAQGILVNDKNEARQKLIDRCDGLKNDRENIKNKIKDAKDAILGVDQEIMLDKQKMKEEIEAIQAKYKEMENSLKSSKSASIQFIEIKNEQIEKSSVEIKKLEDEISNTPLLSADDLRKQYAEVELEIERTNQFDELMKRHEQLKEKEKTYVESKILYNELDDCFKYYAYELPKRMINRANLPVENIEFREEELYVNDRHIERLSTAERNIVAVKLAVALAKAKGHVAVCLDGIEIFDHEHRKEFLNAVKDQGLKVLYTRHGQPENEFETKVGE